MIATEAALYGTSTRSSDRPAEPRSATFTVCGCGQEIAGLRREHCPRCGCCLA